MVVRSIKSIPAKKLAFVWQCWFDVLAQFVAINGMGHAVKVDGKKVPKWSILKFMRILGLGLLKPKDQARYQQGLFIVEKMKKHIQAGGLYYTHNPLSKFILLYLDVDDHAEGGSGLSRVNS